MWHRSVNSVDQDHDKIAQESHNVEYTNWIVISYWQDLAQYCDSNDQLKVRTLGGKVSTALPD